MKPLAELLRNLSRPGVVELTLATGRPPMIRGSNGFEPLEPSPVTTEDVTRALQAMVGLARAATVTETPVQWSVNATGLGALSIAAMRRGDLMHLRLTRATEGAAAAASAAPAPAVSANAGPAASASATSAAPAQAGAASSAYGTRGASAHAGATSPTHAGSAASAHAGANAPAQAGAAPSTYAAPGSASHAGAASSAYAAPGSAAHAGATSPAYNGAAASGSGASAYATPGASTHGGGASAYGTPGSAAQNGASAPAPAASARAAAAPVASAPRPFVGASRGLAALLEEGRREGASDIHVIAGRPVLFRLSGDLLPRGEALDPAMAERLLLAVVPERLRPVLEREGSCDFSLDSPEMGRFRVNVGRQRTGLKGTFRVIAREVPTLESLGLPTDIAKATHHHQGLIVITGPSGHGKTSTLAALVDIINRETTHHVLTVEDPVEYIHTRKKALISQREVGSHTRTFASALKGSLREDPDVIVVGELRDTETVRMALAASETGHLLISTMNTPSAAKTIDRLIDLFPPADQQQVRLSLASGLRLIVSQRLLPAADGKGLVAAAEVLPGSVALGNLIRDNKTFQIPSLQQRGKSLGIVRFEDSLADLVRANKVKLDVAKGYSDNPDELEAMVTGKRPGATVAAPETPQESARLLGKMGSMLGRKGA